MSKPKAPTPTPKPEGAKKDEGEFLPPARVKGRYEDIDEAVKRHLQEIWEEDTINYGEKEKEEIVDYQPPQRKNLREYLGKVIIIADARVAYSRKYNSEISFITIDNNGNYEEAFSLSRVIARQLKEEIIPILRAGKKVRALVDKEMNFITLKPPSMAKQG
jgi:Arc/MetJ-type ribon-helix-helix transcriptional regulator